MRDRGLSVDDAEILATTAWTTDELGDAIAAHKPVGPFDLVTLLVGVNDHYRSRSLDAFATEFAPVFKRAVSLVKRRPGRVIVLSIPDWGATPFAKGRDHEAIGREIDVYNRRARQIAEERGAAWVDVTNVSRRMRDDHTLVTSDGLHPSGRMYREWAELVLPVALSALRASKRAAR